MDIYGFSFIIYDTISFLASLNPGAFFIYSFYLDSLNYLSHFNTTGATSINFFTNSSLNDYSVVYGAFYFFFFKAYSKIDKCSTSPTPDANWFRLNYKIKYFFVKLTFLIKHFLLFFSLQHSEFRINLEKISSTKPKI